MNKNQSYVPSPELILDYLDGILASDRADELKKLEATDEYFKGIVDGVRVLIDEGISRGEIEDYLNQLAQTALPPKKRVFNWMPVSIAASIIFILSLGGYYQFFYSNAEDIVSQEIRVIYPPPLSIRGQQLLNDNIANATILYQQADYDRAALLFAEEFQKDPSNLMCQFYLGLCYVYQSASDYSNAVIHLTAVVDSDNLFRIRAAWYLALIYLQEGESAKAKPLLKMVVANNSFKVESAQELLQKL